MSASYPTALQATTTATGASAVTSGNSAGAAAAAGARSRRARQADARERGPLPDVVVDRSERYELVRAWPRGSDHVLVELAAEDGSTVAAQWFAAPDALTAAVERAPAPARVVGDMLLHPDGADARLCALPGVLGEAGASLVAHRPGRRAVVRVADYKGATVEFVKVVRTSKGTDLARRGGLVASLIGDDVPVPRLLDNSEPERGVLRWSVVPGRTLHELGATGEWSVDEVRAAWRTAGSAVARLHSCPAEHVAARHGVADELDALASWLHPAVTHGLLDADLVAEAGERVTVELESGVDDSALGVLHRDLHDKQLLVEEGAVGIIDVDTLAVGERALDVANLLVHLELRQAQGLLTAEPAAAAREGFLSGVGSDELPDSRIAAYTRATRLRLAGVYAFRPRWRPVANDLLRQAAAG